MATLIVEQGGRRTGGALGGRVIIGRRPGNHVVVPDRSVARLHAWIGLCDKGYYLADTGTRGGTRLNGRPVTSRELLRDGDRIQIGPADITFREDDRLPAGVQPMDLSDRAIGGDDGFFLDCTCGAPLWAPWDFAGRIGQCRYCGSSLKLPARNGNAPSVAQSSDTVAGVTVGPAEVLDPSRNPQNRKTIRPETRAEPLVCGACQSAIGAAEQIARCPECGVAFHVQCWVENRGCSSYGCSKVGALEPERNDEPIDVAGDAEAPESAAPAQAAGWEYLLLPASLMLGIGGLFGFGVPPLVLAAAILFRRRAGEGTNVAKVAKVAKVALAVAVALGMAGVAFSWYWFFGGSPRWRR